MQFNVKDTAVNITATTQSALEGTVADLLAAGEGFAIATLNLDHIVKLRSSAAFRAAYAAQDIVTADGNPIVWLSQIARKPVHLLPGADLVIPLAQIAAAAGRSVALVGSTDRALAGAAKTLREAVPGLQVALIYPPAMGFDPQGAEAAKILADLESANIGLAFLALGAPKQEILAARGRELAPSVGFASIGAGLDFLAGTQRRAPGWVRGMALEWFWRIMMDPKRLLVRYFRCGVILPGLAWDAWRSR